MDPDLESDEMSDETLSKGQNCDVQQSNESFIYRFVCTSVQPKSLQIIASSGPDHKSRNGTSTQSQKSDVQQKYKS